MNTGTAMNHSPIDLNSRTRVLELTPADMTVTVESGLTLAALQTELAKHRQWLPIDPPNADGLSIHDLLARDLSGPRRFGYGTVREHLIGMKVALADGRVIKSGGKVVKNVAGYDLAKLFIGARGSLGTIVEATFKLRPWPEVERIVGAQVEQLDELKVLLLAVLESELTPVILDAHRSADSHVRANTNEHADSAVRAPIQIILGFAGTREEVEWQMEQAEKLGFAQPASLDYEAAFWSDSAPAHRLSVLPSRLTDSLAQLGPRSFVARAGNGTIYYRGEPVGAKSILPLELMRRVKAAYDPKNLLPEFPS